MATEDKNQLKDVSKLNSEADVIAMLKAHPDFQMPPDEEDGKESPLEENEASFEVPAWLNTLCFIAVVLMCNQLKFAFPSKIANLLHCSALAKGMIAWADLGFLAAFIGMAIHMFKSKKTVSIPRLAPLAIAAVAIANIAARPGMGGAVETAQLAEQLFGGVILFAFMTKYMPMTTMAAVSTAIGLNILVAIIQYVSSGYYLVLAPADVKALPLGCGAAMTGLFRSRMAFSFFMATSLAWAVPQWFACSGHCSKSCANRCIIAVCALIVAFFFIPHGQIRILAFIGVIAAAAIVSAKAGWFTTLAALISLSAFAFLPDPLPWSTFKESVSPLKGANYVADATLLFNRKEPYVSDEPAENAHELKTCHFDFIAACRMACKLPWHGVGSSKYQTNIRRCYQPDLPSPGGVNDIETDTQAGWGILLGTVGFPATIIVLVMMLIAIGGNMRRVTQTPMGVGSMAALVLFIAGMFISDPLTRGIGWIFALTLASSTIPKNYIIRQWTSLNITKLVIIGIPLVVLIGCIAIRPEDSDPLTTAAQKARQVTKEQAPSQPQAVAEQPAAPAEQAPAENQKPDEAKAPEAPAAEKPFNPSSNELLKILNASQAQQITAPMEKAEDADAPDGTILVIPDGKGVPPQGKQPDLAYGGCVFEFETEEDFNAEIWLNVVWDGSCGNTIDIRLDDEKKSLTIGNDGTYNSWHWMKSPKSYKLPAGKHKLFILNREDGIKFAQVFITNDKELVPQGFEEE